MSEISHPGLACHTGIHLWHVNTLIAIGIIVPKNNFGTASKSTWFSNPNGPDHSPLLGENFDNREGQTLGPHVLFIRLFLLLTSTHAS